MRELSHLIQSIPSSATVAIADKANALRAAGHNVIALAGGDPDFATAPHIVEAAIQAMHAGKTNYPAPSKGIMVAMEAIAEKVLADSGRTINPASDVIITPGGKWGLALALWSILNTGDEVLYLEPAWVSYVPLIRMAGGVPVAVGLDGADNFRITAEQLTAHITPRTKAIMVNSPSNPTGRVMTAAEAQAIAQVANEHDLFVISDELYEKLVFDGRQHISLMGLPGMDERTLTVNGLSKGYAMTGWRLGWLVGPTAVLKLAAKMHSQTLTSAAHFTMYAAVAALRGPQEQVTHMRDAYQARRDFIVPALNALPGIECPMIEGAFYVMPHFPHSSRNSVELAEALLEKAGVAGTPGLAFGPSAEKRVRFSIATALSDLEQAVERMAKIADEL